MDQSGSQGQAGGLEWHSRYGVVGKYDDTIFFHRGKKYPLLLPIFFFFHSSSFFPFFFFMFHNDSIIKYERKSPLRPDCLFSKFKSLALHLQPPMKHLLVNNSTPFVL